MKNNYNSKYGVYPVLGWKVFARIVKLETTRALKKLSLTNWTDLFAHRILLFKNCLLLKRSTPFKSVGFVQTLYRKSF